MMRFTNLKKWTQPLTPPIKTLTLTCQFLQRCSVSGTAKGKGKIKEGQALKRSKITIKKGQQGTDSSAKGGGGGPRRKEHDQMITSCLNATSPVRYLKPKEREREAEREKMGLLSEARKQEIADLKAAKKAKKTEDRVHGIIGTQGLDLITLGLVADVDKIPKYELTVEDGRKLAKEYSRVMMRKHRERQKAETEFLKCKRAAIEALPEHLRVAALVPDFSPSPANRLIASLTPPIEGYMEQMTEAAKKNYTKEKLR